MTLHLHLAIWMKVVSTLELLGEGLGEAGAVRGKLPIIPVCMEMANHVSWSGWHSSAPLLQSAGCAKG